MIKKSQYKQDKYLFTMHGFLIVLLFIWLIAMTILLFTCGKFCVRWCQGVGNPIETYPPETISLNPSIVIDLTPNSTSGHKTIQILPQKDGAYEDRASPCIQQFAVGDMRLVGAII